MKAIDNEMLRIALLYHEAGLCVIPLKKDKKPHFKWTKYQKERPTEKEITGWWKKYPDANIGIVTGKVSNLVVIDVDKGSGGLDTLEWLTIPDTPTVQTGGGGFHFYFRHPGGEISNFQGRGDLPGIDLRGDGGYVVAPPSSHASGEEYTWVEGKALDSIFMVDLPDWVCEKKEDKAPVKDLYQGVSTGNRNQSLARISGSWVRDGLSLRECVDLAEIWNSKNEPPMPEEEVKRTVRSIFEKHYSHGEDFNYESVLQLGKELKKLDVKVEWLVDKLIPKESIILLAGRGGIGKTYLSLQIAKAVSSGKSFLGLDVSPAPVSYVDYENALPVLVERIRLLSVDEVLFWHTTNHTLVPPKLDSPQYDMLKKLPPGVIIVDTLRASHNKDENESKEMSSIMNRLKEIRDCGNTVIVLHHTSKADRMSSKGSTAIVDLADHVLSLSEVDMTRKALKQVAGDYRDNPIYVFGTHQKTRYKPFRIFLTFDPDRNGFSQVQDKRLLAMLREAG